MNIIRWILVLPVAFISIIVTYFLQRIFLVLSGIFPDSIATNIFVGFLSGAAFIFSGTYVAPSHKNKTAISLLVIGVSLSIASFFIKFQYQNASFMVGLISIYYEINKRGFDTVSRGY